MSFLFGSSSTNSTGEDASTGTAVASPSSPGEHAAALEAGFPLNSLSLHGGAAASASSGAANAAGSSILTADVNSAVAWIQAVRYGASAGFDDLLLRLDADNKNLAKRLRAQLDENQALRERMEMLTTDLSVTKEANAALLQDVAKLNSAVVELKRRHRWQPPLSQMASGDRGYINTRTKAKSGKKKAATAAAHPQHHHHHHEDPSALGAKEIIKLAIGPSSHPEHHHHHHQHNHHHPLVNATSSAPGIAVPAAAPAAATGTGAGSAAAAAAAPGAVERVIGGAVSLLRTLPSLPFVGNNNSNSAATTAAVSSSAGATGFDVNTVPLSAFTTSANNTASSSSPSSPPLIATVATTTAAAAAAADRRAASLSPTMLSRAAKAAAASDNGNERDNSRQQRKATSSSLSESGLLLGAASSAAPPPSSFAPASASGSAASGCACSCHLHHRQRRGRHHRHHHHHGQGHHPHRRPSGTSSSSSAAARPASTVDNVSSRSPSPLRSQSSSSPHSRSGSRSSGSYSSSSSSYTGDDDDDRRYSPRDSPFTEEEGEGDDDDDGAISLVSTDDDEVIGALGELGKHYRKHHGRNKNNNVVKPAGEGAGAGEGGLFAAGDGTATAAAAAAALADASAGGLLSAASSAVANAIRRRLPWGAATDPPLPPTPALVPSAPPAPGTPMATTASAGASAIPGTPVPAVPSSAAAVDGATTINLSKRLSGSDLAPLLPNDSLNLSGSAIITSEGAGAGASPDRLQHHQHHHRSHRHHGHHGHHAGSSSNNNRPPRHDHHHHGHHSSHSHSHSLALPPKPRRESTSASSVASSSRRSVSQQQQPQAQQPDGERDRERDRDRGRASSSSSRVGGAVGGTGNGNGLCFSGEYARGALLSIEASQHKWLRRLTALERGHGLEASVHAVLQELYLVLIQIHSLLMMAAASASVKEESTTTAAPGSTNGNGNGSSSSSLVAVKIAVQPEALDLASLLTSRCLALQLPLLSLLQERKDSEAYANTAFAWHKGAQRLLEGLQLSKHAKAVLMEEQTQQQQRRWQQHQKEQQQQQQPPQEHAKPSIALPAGAGAVIAAPPAAESSGSFASSIVAPASSSSSSLSGTAYPLGTSSSALASSASPAASCVSAVSPRPLGAAGPMASLRLPDATAVEEVTEEERGGDESRGMQEVEQDEQEQLARSTIGVVGPEALADPNKKEARREDATDLLALEALDKVEADASKQMMRMATRQHEQQDQETTMGSPFIVGSSGATKTEETVSPAPVVAATSGLVTATAAMPPSQQQRLALPSTQAAATILLPPRLLERVPWLHYSLQKLTPAALMGIAPLLRELGAVEAKAQAQVEGETEAMMGAGLLSRPQIGVLPDDEEEQGQQDGGDGNETSPAASPGEQGQSDKAVLAPKRRKLVNSDPHKLGILLQLRGQQLYQQQKERAKYLRSVAASGSAAVPRLLTPPPRRGLRILVLDGGGIRGLLALEFLKRIELECGRPIVELFDLICGTSTGGMIAVALCARKSLSEIAQQYERIRTAFQGQSGFFAEAKRLATGAAYSTATAEGLIKRFFNEKKGSKKGGHKAKASKQAGPVVAAATTGAENGGAGAEGALGDVGGGSQGAGVVRSKAAAAAFGILASTTTFASSSSSSFASNSSPEPSPLIASGAAAGFEVNKARRKAANGALSAGDETGRTHTTDATGTLDEEEDDDGGTPLPTPTDVEDGTTDAERQGRGQVAASSAEGDDDDDNNNRGKEGADDDDDDDGGTPLHMSDLPSTPKCFVVAAECSLDPPSPYLFRSYELSTAAKKASEFVGSSSVLCHEAVRATTSAPTFYRNALIANNLFCDGAVLANSPVLMALCEASVLWPGATIDVMCSVGTGSITRKPTPPSGVFSWVKSMMELALSPELVNKIASSLLGGTGSLGPLALNPDGSVVGDEDDGSGNPSQPHATPCRYIRFDVPGAGDFDLSEMRLTEVAKMLEMGRKHVARVAREGSFARLRHALGVPPPPPPPEAIEATMTAGAGAGAGSAASRQNHHQQRQRKLPEPQPPVALGLASYEQEQEEQRRREERRERREQEKAAAVAAVAAGAASTSAGGGVIPSKSQSESGLSIVAPAPLAEAMKPQLPPPSTASVPLAAPSAVPVPVPNPFIRPSPSAATAAATAAAAAAGGSNNTNNN